MLQMQAHGFKEMEARLKAMPDDLMEKAIKHSVRQSCLIVRDDAKAMAPVHEGPYPISRTRSMESFQEPLAQMKGIIAQLQEEYKYPVGYEYLTTKRKRQRAERKQAKAVRRTVEKMMKLTGRDIWNRIRRPGTIRDAITIKLSNSKGKDDIRYGVGLFSKEAYYGRWLEYGHEGKGKKYVAARRFLRPALYGNKEQIMDIIRKRLNERMGMTRKAA